VEKPTKDDSGAEGRRACFKESSTIEAPPAPHAAEKERPVYKDTDYIEIITFVPAHNTAQEDVMGEHENIIAGGMAGLQDLDPAVCISMEGNSE